MNTNKTVAAVMALGLLLIAAVAWAAADEKMITGVISGVNPTTRIATVTPASGAPIVVQFAFNAGGIRNVACRLMKLYAKKCNAMECSRFAHRQQKVTGRSLTILATGVVDN